MKFRHFGLVLGLISLTSCGGAFEVREKAMTLSPEGQNVQVFETVRNGCNDLGEILLSFGLGTDDGDLLRTLVSNYFRNTTAEMGGDATSFGDIEFYDYHMQGNPAGSFQYLEVRGHAYNCA